MPPKSSEVEEDSFALALNSDVESISIVGLLGHQRVTPVVRNLVRDRRRVEADPGREGAQQATCEDVNGEVRRARHLNVPAALVVRRAAGEGRWVVLPGLDERVHD